MYVSESNVCVVDVGRKSEGVKRFIKLIRVSDEKQNGHIIVVIALFIYLIFLFLVNRAVSVAVGIDVNVFAYHVVNVCRTASVYLDIHSDVSYSYYVAVFEENILHVAGTLRSPYLNGSAPFAP